MTSKTNIIILFKFSCIYFIFNCKFYVLIYLRYVLSNISRKFYFIFSNIFFFNLTINTLRSFSYPIMIILIIIYIFHYQIFFIFSNKHCILNILIFFIHINVIVQMIIFNATYSLSTKSYSNIERKIAVFINF